MYCAESTGKNRSINKLLPLLVVYTITISLEVSALEVVNQPVELSEADYFAEIPVVLSATRLQQPVSEAPVAVSIIDREMIDASGFTEIPDLLRLVPGFLVSYDSGHVIAAGYHLLHDRYVRHQQVLIDGRSIYSPLFGGVNWSELPIVIDDIERIEVVRGPNASTYGSNSFLGVINIITRHASQDRGQYVKVNAGTNNYRNGVYRTGSNIGNLDYRVTMNYRQDDGFENRFDGKQVRVLTARGDYLLDNSNNISFQLGHNEGPREEDNAIDLSVPDHLKDTKSQFQQISWRHTQSDTNEYKIQFYHNLEDEQQSFSGTDYSLKTDRMELEFENQIKIDTSLRLIWGASTRTDQVASLFYMGTTDYLKNYIKRIFANAEYQISDKTLVNGGLMYEENGTAGSDVLPRLSVNHKIDNNNHLRFTVSKATRAPVMFEEDPYYGGFFNGVIDLRPERITSYEVGYIASNSDKSVVVDTKIYYDDIKDLINVSLNGGQYQYDNHDDASIRGLETSITLRPARHTTLITNFSYTSINSTKNIGNSEYGIAFPKYLLSMLLMHDFTSDYQGSLGFYYRTATKPLARITGDPEQLDPYKRLDLRLARKFQLKGMDSVLSLTVQNAFDEVPYTRLMNYPKRQAYISWKTYFK